MIISVKNRIYVESTDGWLGSVTDIRMFGKSIPTDDPIYEEIMNVYHMLPGLIECPPSTAINAMAVLMEEYPNEKVTCDGDISVPYEDGRIY